MLMKRQTILILALLLSVLTAEAQTLTLDECLTAARENYPLARRYGLVERSRDYTLSNASKAWLPSVSLSASGVAFTDIIRENERTQLMGLDMNNTAASAALSVRQTVYDGGRTSAARSAAQAEADKQTHALDTKIYEVDERVEQLFFGVLTIQEQLKQIGLLKDDLALSHRTVESMLRNGTALQADLDAVSVEQLKAEQQEAAFEASRTAYLQMLGTLTGKGDLSQTELVRPAATDLGAGKEVSEGHPMLQYYLSEERRFDAERLRLNANLRPTLSLFGMGLAHTKVSSMLNNTAFLGGLTLSWNIGSLYTRKNDLAQLDLQRQTVANDRERFLFNNRLDNGQAQGAVARLRQQISKDEEIVRLRQRIRTTSDRRLTLGTETVNENLRTLNAVSEARQQKALHEIELLKEIYSIKHLNYEH